MARHITYYIATDAGRFGLNPMSVYHRQYLGTLKPDAKTVSGKHLYKRATLERLSKLVKKRKKHGHS